MHIPTLAQFNAYKSVQDSGLTNMYDSGRVDELAQEFEQVELPPEVILNIISEYEDYFDIWERHQDSPELFNHLITDPVLA